MIYRCYSVKDLKAAAFAPPFFLGRDEVAVRTFRDALEDKSHPMSAHPEDYELFYLGEFDDERGSLTGASAPVFLCNGNGEMIRG
ncbi:nonstructural protein [robinz microvirus RP_160]|nr:nonstructural protein [robinz microvirus RP_160]